MSLELLGMLQQFYGFAVLNIIFCEVVQFHNGHHSFWRSYDRPVCPRMIFANADMDETAVAPHVVCCVMDSV